MAAGYVVMIGSLGNNKYLYKNVNMFFFTLWIKDSLGTVVLFPFERKERQLMKTRLKYT